MTISLEQAQFSLADIVHQLSPGDEIVITENNHPVARILPARPPKPVRQLGTMRGSVLSMSPDFDAPLDDFQDYRQ
ncbi:MAG: DUF2281 domain-containing protein [Pirellulaceae bacterium]|nr:DUF2281 domain-containing protein [Pirellulaceae bacterium]